MGVKMLYLGVFLIFIALLLFTYSILYLANLNRIAILSRIEDIDNINSINRNKVLSFSERVLMPFINIINNLFIKIIPINKRKDVLQKLDRAGLLKSMTTEKWLVAKMIISIIFSLLTGTTSYYIEKDYIKSFFLALIVIVLINYMFRFYLLRMIEKRKRNILRELPFTLDLITVSVEAGISFDGAIARVINNMDSDLSDEFSKALKEMRMGIDKKQALKKMGDRCDVKVLTMLLTSIIQADELGVSLAKVLRIESAQLREHRKQVARERAMKAPVKMLFPLIFFIFPSIFVIIIGPAVIRIFEIF
jgi:tight adherence protein C